MDILYIWAWLAVWLAGAGVAIGQWIMAKTSLDAMGKNPEISWSFLVLTVLGIALIESAVIYALIVGFQILGLDPETLANIYSPIWAWLAIWLAGMWAGIWEGKLVSWAMDAILRNPDMRGKIMTYMVLFVALVESVAIYGLIIALNLMW